MLKAVFFDLFNTLARYDPPREQLYHRAFKEIGIEIPVKDVMRGILSADHIYFAENAKRPVRERSPEEQLKVFLCYPESILTRANIIVSQDIQLNLVRKILKEYRDMNIVLYADVLTTLKSLRERNLVIGLLTNADTRGASTFCNKLGIMPYLNFIATSQEAGAEKPSPPIFLMALERAGVKATEAVHIGDQYQADVLGARSVGIAAILIDRYDISTDITDCPRIIGLNQLDQYITAK